MAVRRRLIPKINPGDWNGVAYAISRLARELDTGSNPTFAGMNLTGNAVIGGNATISGTLAVTGTVSITGGLTLGSDLNMGCNEIKNFKVHIVADSAAMLALTCGQGQMCFREDTDKFYGRLE